MVQRGRTFALDGTFSPFLLRSPDLVSFQVITFLSPPSCPHLRSLWETTDLDSKYYSYLLGCDIALCGCCSAHPCCDASLAVRCLASGRTSIIECLKFAITGAYPPGGYKSQTFVYDSKNHQIAIPRYTEQEKCRSLVIALTKAACSRQQEGAPLTSWDWDRNCTGTGIQCLDLNQTIARLMGVSKAVLDHVVFCHQEDLSWPCQLEAGSLKTRFDEIFDCTGYVNALKVYLDLNAELALEADGLQDKLTCLHSLRQTAKSIRKQILTKQLRKEGFTQDIKNLQENSNGGRDSIKEQIALLKGQKQELKIGSCAICLLTSTIVLVLFCFLLDQEGAGP